MTGPGGRGMISAVAGERDHDEKSWRTREATLRYRARFRAEQIGPRYHGWLHFAFTSIASLAIIALAISRLDDVSLAQWLTVPLSFLLANGAEYFGHRGPMHRKKRRAEILYQRHTREHHRFFTPAAMSCESPRDFKIMLFPPAMLVFFLGLIAAPIGALLFAFFHPNVAWLFVATAMGYYLTYEWLHFSYHLPLQSRLGGLRVVQALRRHHAAHHDPALMGRYNFNITFPIFDALLGTTWRAPAGEQRLSPE